MKQLITLLFSVLLIGLIGCNGDKETPPPPTPPTPTLEATPTSLSFESIATAAKTVSITANGDWTASSSESWCTLSAATGSKNGTISVTVANNTGLESRPAVVTIKSNDLTVLVNVSQLGESPDLLLDETPRTLEAVAGTLQIEVTTNVECEVTMAPANCDWLTEVPSKTMVKHTHNYEYMANTGAQREVVLTFTHKGGKISKSITIMQNAANNQLYTVEEFKALTTVGVYFSKENVFVYNMKDHQFAINQASGSQRVQTYNQDTIGAFSFSDKPSKADQKLTLNLDYLIQGVGEISKLDVVVVKVDSEKAWLWNTEKSYGYIVKLAK